FLCPIPCQPGDLFEIFHVDGYMIHLVPPSKYFKIGSSNAFMFLTGEAVVTKEPLEHVAWGCLCWVHNCLDPKYRPRPVGEIISSAEEMVGDQKLHKVIFNNSECFVTDLKYGQPLCKLVRPPLGLCVEMYILWLLGGMFSYISIKSICSRV
uniref:LRAT domain-containing protein n=1 Tax=Piliocolobus tephrosceles TaxID=591936 RepID=A0A8C9H2X9_9PRIM